ncbi:MAG: hypothetical protein OEM59_05385 [Rhodospirillales bacterium]|nr:hypothetical protein [Rhodospirillales bacterium]
MTYTFHGIDETRKQPPQRMASAMLDVVAVLVGLAIAVPFFLVLSLPFVAGL